MSSAADEALAEERGMRPLVAQCHFGLGRLCEQIDRLGDAESHVDLAHTMSRDMNMSFWQDQRGATT